MPFLVLAGIHGVEPSQIHFKPHQSQALLLDSLCDQLPRSLMPTMITAIVIMGSTLPTRILLEECAQALVEYRSYPLTGE